MSDIVVRPQLWATTAISSVVESIDWGSLPEWLAAGGTILALYFAVRTLRVQSSELALQREELSLQRVELAKNVEIQAQISHSQERLSDMQERSLDMQERLFVVQIEAHEATLGFIEAWRNVRRAGRSTLGLIKTSSIEVGAMQTITFESYQSQAVSTSSRHKDCTIRVPRKVDVAHLEAMRDAFVLGQSRRESDLASAAYFIYVFCLRPLVECKEMARKTQDWGTVERLVIPLWARRDYLKKIVELAHRKSVKPSVLWDFERPEDLRPPIIDEWPTLSEVRSLD